MSNLVCEARHCRVHRIPVISSPLATDNFSATAAVGKAISAIQAGGCDGANGSAMKCNCHALCPDAGCISLLLMVLLAS